MKVVLVVGVLEVVLAVLVAAFATVVFIIVVRAL